MMPLGLVSTSAFLLTVVIIMRRLVKPLRRTMVCQTSTMVRHQANHRPRP